MKLIVLALLPLSGCGTLLAPGPDPIRVETDPPGATVTAQSRPAGKTPVVVLFDRRDPNAELVVELEGYRTERVQVNERMNGWSILNGLFGLVGVVVGGAIDGIAYNIGRWSRTDLYVELLPADVAPGTPGRLIRGARTKRKAVGVDRWGHTTFETVPVDFEPIPL